MRRLLAMLVLGFLLLPSVAHAVGVLTPVAGDANFMAAERPIESIIATMVNGNTVFTVSGGSIQILELLSVCVTANDATASTMQWQSVPTVGSATTFSGASAALTSATAGTTVLLTPTALSTAPTIVAASAGGVQLGLVAQNHIIVKEGTIKLVIGTGSTTGTWKHLLRYKPLSPSSVVTP
jgi:hypothetical protein